MLNPPGKMPPPVSDARMAAAWADAIAERVNLFGLGPWFAELSAWLGFDDLLWLPESVDDEDVVVPVPGRALQLSLVATDSFEHALEMHRAQHVFIEDVIFNARLMRSGLPGCALPFGLQVKNETPDSAVSRLADRGTFRCQRDPECGLVCFLSDHRIITLSFDASEQNIDYVHIARANDPQPAPQAGLVS